VESTLIAIESEVLFVDLDEISLKETLGAVNKSEDLTVIAIKQRRNDVMPSRSLPTVEAYPNACFSSG